MTFSGTATSRVAAVEPGQRRPIAVLGSVYRPLSYLYHLAGRFLHGYSSEGGTQFPAHRIESLWLDQLPANDISGDLCRRFGIRRARSVRDALLMGDRLAVDGALIVLEHGNYARNARGQILYPREPIFAQVVDALQHAGQTIPVFLAKHLSHSFDEALDMFETARAFDLPLMAGSALPTAHHFPALSIAAGDPIREVLVAGYGPIEVFGFDALEAVQSIAEKRRGGESGVSAVRCLTGDEVWHAGDRGLWSWDLLQAALACGESVNLGDVRDNVGAVSLPGMPANPPVAFLIEYTDGTRATVLLLNGHIQEFLAAVRPTDARAMTACRFLTPPAPGMHHFDSHVDAIDRFLLSRQPTTPLQRTLLTTGLMERLLESAHDSGGRLPTPELTIQYRIDAD
jgi:hypothetical protein